MCSGLLVPHWLSTNYLSLPLDKLGAYCLICPAYSGFFWPCVLKYTLSVHHPTAIDCAFSLISSLVY